MILKPISQPSHWLFWLLLILGSLTLGACQGSVSLPSLNPNPAPTFDSSQVVFPTVVAPPEGRSGLTGYVIGRDTNQPVQGVAVQLAEVFRDENNDGIYVLDYAQSPYTETNELGWFSFTDLNPTEYVLVVGWVESNDYYIVQDENGLPLVWQTTANNVTDVGQVVTNPIQYLVRQESLTAEPPEAYPAPTNYP
jgi:hypothetical protein